MSVTKQKSLADVVFNSLRSSKKSLLLVIATGAVAAPVSFGLVNTSHILAQLLHATGAPSPSFEVASIKPSPPGSHGSHFSRSRERFSARATARVIIQDAYGAQTEDQILGGPAWIKSEEYDVDAKIEDSLFDKLRKLPDAQQTDQVRFMIQSLLADRFQLKVSYATKQLPIYALVVAKNGPRLNPPAAPKGNSGTEGRDTELSGSNASLGMLADELSRKSEVGRVVIDKTGLTGKYDWTLKWTPDDSAPMFKETGKGAAATASTPSANSSGPSFFTAIQEQLGLKLEPKKGPVEVLVIESIERPSQN